MPDNLEMDASAPAFVHGERVINAGEWVSQDMAIAYAWDMAAIRAMQRTEADIKARDRRLVRQRVCYILAALIRRANGATARPLGPRKGKGKS